MVNIASRKNKEGHMRCCNKQKGYAHLCVFITIAYTFCFTSCLRNRAIAHADAITCIAHEDGTFAKLSKELEYTDAISYTSPQDLAKELQAAGWSEEGLMVERFFIAKSSATAMSLKYFVARSAKVPTSLHCINVERRLYGTISEKEALAAIVITSENLESVGRVMMEGNAETLEKLRANVDAKRHVVYLKDDKTWNAIRTLMRNRSAR